MKIAVALSIGTKELDPQIADIEKVLRSLEVEYAIVLAGHERLDPHGCELARKAASGNPNVHLAFASSGTFSRAYLAGWEEGVALGADFVISMDADGSHDPEDIQTFVKHFRKGAEVVCSSRFLPGAVNQYPAQRQALSKGVTTLANWFLVKKSERLTDFASGFEGVSSKMISKIFQRCRPDDWLSVRFGPYHLQNTILRLLLIYEGCKIEEIPISYGVKRVGKVLGIKYVVHALACFALLYLDHFRLRKTRQVRVFS